MAAKTWKIEKDLCRCCHAEGAFDNLAEPRIFLEKEEIYSDMLRECLDIDIPPVPGELCAITYTICTTCITRLRDACNFKKQVQDCEQRFMTLYYKNAIQGIKPETIVKEEVDVTIEEVHSEEDVERIVKKEDDSDDDDNLTGGAADDDDISEDFSIKRTRSSTKPKPKPKPKAKPKAVKKEKPQPQAKKKPEPKAVKEKKGVHHITESDGTRVCNVCGECFTSKRTFLLHNRTVHPELIRKRSNETKCRHCREMVSQWNRQQHLKQVHNIQPPTCGVCGKTFRINSALLNHTRAVHMKEKNFFCKTCGLGFTMNSHLLRHQRSHSSEKPFACDVCGKGFRWKPNLTSHVMIHFKDKRKKCAVCGERFVQKASLNYHMTKHHPEVPF